MVWFCRLGAAAGRNGFMNVLVIDVGGTHVKVFVTGESEPRKLASGPRLTARQMIARVKKITADWKQDAVSIGFPGPVLRIRPVAEPRNLGKGWFGFNFRSAFDCPVKKGKKKWRRHVADVVARLVATLEPDAVVLGGGNVKELKKLPPPNAVRATTAMRFAEDFDRGRQTNHILCPTQDPL